MSKKLAVIGSSGGNLYNQGGSNAEGMMKEIFMQADSAGIEIAWLQYVLASGSMDNISMDSPATLFGINGKTLEEKASGTLTEVNGAAEAEDAKLAEEILAGNIDGLIVMSADPEKINAKAVQAAAKMGIPVAGTGGTSVSRIQEAGCKVISASGTTGTTNRTRAVAFITAFAKEWGMKYMPVIGNTGSAASEKMEANIWKRINFRGIMMTSMPAFIAMALVLAISKIPGLDGLSGVFDTLVGSLPVVVAAVAAKQVSGLDEVGVVAGVVAGLLSVDGGIIGGLASGILAGVFAYYLIVACFRYKVPGTTANIIAGGLGGLVAGLIGMYAIAPVALVLGNGIRSLIDSALAINPILAGALAGLLIWPAIIGGVYHAAILPIVLLEMESTGFSFLGAIDMTGLVMVSAGITLANVLFPRKKGDNAIAFPGFCINVAFGTFVEAAYPYMFSDKIVFAGSLIAAAVSGAFVGMFDVKGTAYVPAVVAPGMANDGKGMYFLLAMLIAAGVAFIITVIANKRARAMDEK